MPPPDIDRIVGESFVKKVDYLAEVSSTNDHAAYLANQGTNELPLLVIADNQSAGRGRGANRWWTGKGSLAFSFLFKPELINLNPQSVPLISLAAGVATAETIQPLLPEILVGINWPNDVMAAGRKVSGILVEVLPQRQAIIGIGINTNNRMADAPAELIATGTTLMDLTGSMHDHTSILIALIQHLEKHLQTIAKDPTQLTSEANQICLQHGKMLTLQLGSRRASGLCKGIASDGALVLETSDGPQSFYSGTVLES